MRDEEDGLALFCEAAHDLHELVDLLGGQNGGGLVEDEDLVVAVEHFEDLDTLLHTDGNVGDQGVGLDPQAVLFGQRHHLLAGFLLLQDAELRGLVAQDDVVQNREAFH